MKEASVGSLVRCHGTLVNKAVLDVSQFPLARPIKLMRRISRRLLREAQRWWTLGLVKPGWGRDDPQAGGIYRQYSEGGKVKTGD